MNLCHTSGRNRLLVTSVDDLLMVGVNGPLLAMWNAEKYVVSWLKAGSHGALDRVAGLPKKVGTARHSSKLFSWLSNFHVDVEICDVYHFLPEYSCVRWTQTHIVQLSFLFGGRQQSDTKNPFYVDIPPCLFNLKMWYLTTIECAEYDTFSAASSRFFPQIALPPFALHGAERAIVSVDIRSNDSIFNCRHMERYQTNSIQLDWTGQSMSSMLCSVDDRNK